MEDRRIAFEAWAHSSTVHCNMWASEMSLMSNLVCVWQEGICEGRKKERKMGKKGSSRGRNKRFPTTLAEIPTSRLKEILATPQAYGGENK